MVDTIERHTQIIHKYNYIDINCMKTIIKIRVTEYLPLTKL